MPNSNKSVNGTPSGGAGGRGKAAMTKAGAGGVGMRGGMKPTTRTVPKLKGAHSIGGGRARGMAGGA